MARPVIVASAEKTGTHFTASTCARLLGRSAAWLTPSHRAEFARPNIGVLVTHVYPEGWRSHADAIYDLVSTSACPIVVPVRDPLAAFRSKSERPKDPLDTIGLAESMKRLTRLQRRPNTFFFCVERPNYAALARFLCVPEPKIPPRAPRMPTPKANQGPLRSETDLARHFEAELAVLEPVWPFFQRFGYRLGAEVST